MSDRSKDVPTWMFWAMGLSLEISAVASDDAGVPHYVEFVLTLLSGAFLSSVFWRIYYAR